MKSTSASVTSAIDFDDLLEHPVADRGEPRNETLELPGSCLAGFERTSSSKSSRVRPETRCSKEARSRRGTMSVCRIEDGANRSELWTSSSQRCASGPYDGVMISTECAGSPGLRSSDA